MAVKIISLVAVVVLHVQARNFTIDFERDTFMKDGEPFRYISGSIHYVRVPRFYWKDRLLKMAAAGLNTIQTYVPWNFHQQAPNVSDFTGNLDMEAFIQLAQDMGFLVVLRPGPYTDAGWDFGGLASYLMRSTYVNKHIKLRTNDPVYMAEVKSWFDELLPRVKPLLYNNGGPVIAVQVENEYGYHYSCDHNYLRHLRDITRSHLGPDVVLFTVDGAHPATIDCGTVEGLYTTVDFGIGGDPRENFQVQREFEPHGPLVCTEFYVETTLDYWGHNHSVQSPEGAAKALDLVLSTDANVNMYMFEGGTSFGFRNGGLLARKNTFNAVTTTYDHDAPLSEAGDVREKYKTIRDVILKYVKDPKIPIPPDTKKYSYGKIKVEKMGSVVDVLRSVQAPSIQSVNPLCMEDLGQNEGFVLYHHKVQSSHINQPLSVPGVRDRGYVSVNQKVVGLLLRGSKTYLTVTLRAGDSLEILVENMGHLYFGGRDMDTDQKGIVGKVTVGGSVLHHWTMYKVDAADLHRKVLSGVDTQAMAYGGRQGELLTPSIYNGSFLVPEDLSQPLDTYIDMRPWHKGQFYINGHNVGRYWPILGPQVTLYVPASFLLPSPLLNHVTVLELEHSPCERSLDACYITFVDKPFINKTVTA